MDVEGVLFVITQHPRLGRKIENGRSVEIHRYLMSRTQHLLYFQVKRNLIEMLSVWATSRGQEPREAKGSHSGFPTYAQ